MPTWKRTLNDLRRTASAPGQKKLAFKAILRKTAEIEVFLIRFIALDY